MSCLQEVCIDSRTQVYVHSQPNSVVLNRNLTSGVGMVAGWVRRERLGALGDMTLLAYIHTEL